MYFKRIFEKMALTKFGFFRGFLRFLGDPKKFSKRGFFRGVLGYFEGRARPKILRGFPAMNRFQNLDFQWFPAIFRGPKKFSKRGFFIFPQFLGILKDRLVQKFSELGLLRSILGILKGRTQVLPEYPEGEVGQEEGGAVPLG
jgi:hypothetical protein